jgi:hypothetical protein
VEEVLRYRLLWLKECVENCQFFSDLAGIDHEVLRGIER